MEINGITKKNIQTSDHSLNHFPKKVQISTLLTVFFQLSPQEAFEMEKLICCFLPPNRPPPCLTFLWCFHERVTANVSQIVFFKCFIIFLHLSLKRNVILSIDDIDLMLSFAQNVKLRHFWGQFWLQNLPLDHICFSKKGGVIRERGLNRNNTVCIESGRLTAAESNS